jgi:uridylate kinase
METIVISFGGSVLISEDLDIDYYKRFADLLNKLKKNYKIFIVVGGGEIARKYIKLGRKLGLDEKSLDDLGIRVTMINAKFLTNIIDDSNKKIPKTTDDALEMREKIIIMGGTDPGHSTDYVGTELSSKMVADKFIIATNVDGVYDNDPNIYRNAKQIKEITINELIEKYGTRWESAGINTVIDGPALKEIKENMIPTYVLDGKKLEELEKAILNKNFNGTIIKNR